MKLEENRNLQNLEATGKEARTKELLISGKLISPRIMKSQLIGRLLKLIAEEKV